jgi:hypothetical protein
MTDEEFAKEHSSGKSKFAEFLELSVYLLFSFDHGRKVAGHRGH